MTQNGTFMPPEYVAWKDDVAQVLALSLKPIPGNVHLEVTFSKTGMIVMIEPTNDARFGLADIDNLSGGLMDALELSGIIANDRYVVGLDAAFHQEDQ